MAKNTMPYELLVLVVPFFYFSFYTFGNLIELVIEIFVIKEEIILNVEILLEL